MFANNEIEQQSQVGIWVGATLKIKFHYARNFDLSFNSLLHAKQGVAQNEKKYWVHTKMKLSIEYSFYVAGW